MTFSTEYEHSLTSVANILSLITGIFSVKYFRLFCSITDHQNSIPADEQHSTLRIT